MEKLVATKYWYSIEDYFISYCFVNVYELEVDVRNF